MRKGPQDVEKSSGAPKYSICVTHYNNAPTVRRSLDSILDQIDDDYDVTVVDNYSSDGSYEMLKTYADSGAIKLIRAKSSRGKGRQIAFENSAGRYVISNMDLDDIFKPRLAELVGRYHEAAEGKLLWVVSTMETSFWGGGCVAIAPRQLLQELGGWRDLQLFEDTELCVRAALRGMYLRGRFSLFEETNPHGDRTEKRFARVRWKYLRYREIVRCGFPLQLWTTRQTWEQESFRFLMRRFAFPFFKLFKSTFYYNSDGLLYPAIIHEPSLVVSLERSEK